MKINCHEPYDGEWAEATLFAEHDLSDVDLAALREFVGSWAAEYARTINVSGSCAAVRVMPGGDRQTVHVELDRIPQEWIKPFAVNMEKRFPAIWLLEVGHEFVPASRDVTQFISVPAKVVDLEDGTKIDVERFEIAKYPVSIAEYAAFARATGYVTVAEYRNEEESFRSNQVIDHIAKDKRGPLNALEISYVDAQAYCEWAKLRLPTDAEWLAAAIVDDRIYDDFKEAGSKKPDLAKMANALDVDQDEITGTLVNDRVIVRVGPYLVRTRKDLTEKRYRKAVSLRYHEMTAFRVCKLS